MQKILCINKPQGKTPLQTITELKNHYPEYQNEKITYAGRLDPLAHGVLLLLVGDTAKQREEFLALPKTYEFTVLFGVETDTYDMLGYVTEEKIKHVGLNVKLIVNIFVKKYIGKKIISYPPYSSKPVNGKPLFWWARNNKLTGITIPKREIEIYDFVLESINEITIEEVKMKVENAIASVEGDFRQEEILKRWKQLFTSQKNENAKLTTATFRISCSSGTYIRELAHLLGEKTETGAIASDILRTSIGNYILDDSITL